MYSVERLLRVSRGQESAHSTIDSPLEHLVACHGRIEERLAVLERAAAALENQPAQALEAIGNCFRYFDTSGVLHTADEEGSVFPRLRPRIGAAELSEIESLEKQHREADAIYAELKDCTAELRRGVTPELTRRFSEAVSRFAALYRSHIEFENRELIAVARRELNETELTQISEEMKSRRR